MFSNGSSADEYYYKILILGDSSVGKTALRKRFVEGKYPFNLKPTMGTDFGYNTMRLGMKKVRIGMWDVSGLPHFNNVRRLYYGYSNGVILVFDLTRKETLDNLEHWMLEVLEVVGHSIPFVLVGTKYDLQNQIYKDFSKDDVLDLASRLTMYVASIGITIPYVETSALMGYNIERPFKELVSIMIDRTLS